MRNKFAIITLTLIISFLCLFYLSFTFVSRNVQVEANKHATLENGQIDLQKRQVLVDSLWKKPVYNFLGIDFTYQEVKEKELNLGLDLQGGMHVILEISPSEILKSLAGTNQNKAFQEALLKVNDLKKDKNISYVQAFAEAYKELEPEGKLSALFSNAANKDRINFETSDEEVIKILESEVNDAIERSFSILRTRIDKFGVTQPNIQRLPGTDRIQIELPGVDNPERVRNLLQGVAQLEFWKVYEVNEIINSLQRINDYLITKSRANPIEKVDSSKIDIPNEELSLEAQLLKKDSTSALLDSLTPQMSPLFGLLKSGNDLVYSLQDTATINNILSDPKVKSLLPGDIEFKWDVKSTETETGEELMELYAVQKDRGGKALLSGDVITDARQDLDQNKPVVSMQMNGPGAKKWKKITSENIGRRIAIVLDDNVYSAPVVQSEIPNGSSSISGNFTIDEAKDLANILKAGKMPAPTQIVEEAVVGPSLGQEAIFQGLLSMVAGLGLVVLFMVAYYGTGGILANIALFINVFFILGILAQFGAALTLPGIAGIVLTIGMSVDANVLIFERIREELKNGQSLIQAIRIGYDKAYSSIIDSNVTTFLIGAILYSFGSGGIKGFAVVLMIGIASSLFTAVFITRLLVEWLAKRKTKFITFDTWISKGLFDNLNFDFVKKRKLAYVFSSIIIIVGIISIIGQKGLNVGVDFKGGRSYVVRFNETVIASEVRTLLIDNFEGAGVEVKTYDNPNQLKITTSYLIDDNSVNADDKVKLALLQGLDEIKNLEPEIMSSSKVGATMADDIKNTSKTSIIYSLIVIFLYILFRFRKWQFGVGAIVALLHDVLIVFSCFAISRWFGINFEIDQVFIAALLTVIGYSINDTVVVFDRIREFAGSASKDELSKTLNKSLNDTLSRTLITSLTVFIVVLVLFVFGGEVLQGFSFALLVGVVFGTYSSILIAAPVVLDFSMKKLVNKDEKGKINKTKEEKLTPA